MEHAVFSIICLKVLLIGLLLLCTVDGPVLPARGVGTFNFFVPKSSRLPGSLYKRPDEIGNAGNSQNVIWYLFRAWGFRV
jgi:hypothetical protein